MEPLEIERLMIQHVIVHGRTELEDIVQDPFTSLDNWSDLIEEFSTMIFAVLDDLEARGVLEFILEEDGHLLRHTYEIGEQYKTHAQTLTQYGI
jgi:hypothetical protein